jgi:hypothetical protein
MPLGQGSKEDKEGKGDKGDKGDKRDSSETKKDICTNGMLPPHPSSNLMQLLNDLEPELSQEQRQHRETILALVEQACAECLGFQAPLHLVGSARLGVQSPQSDLDVLCLIPAYMSGEAFLESVRQRLEGLCEYAQVVSSVKIPLLRMRLEGVSVYTLDLGLELREGKTRFAWCWD